MSTKALTSAQTEKLLKFLIHIVMHKESLPPSKQASREHMKKSILELLKTDPSLRDKLFGHLHEKQSTEGIRDLKEENKEEL